MTTYRIIRIDLLAPLGVRTATVCFAGLTHAEAVEQIDALRLKRVRGSRYVCAVQVEA